MKKRIGVMTTAVVAVAALALTGCSSSGDSSSSDGGEKTLTLSSLVQPTTFAPQDAGDANYVQWFQTTYDTMIRQAPDGSFEPMLADSWKYDESNTVLTLKLHDGVTFQDGAAFDATAVKVNLEATRDGSGSLAPQLASIKDVVVVDPLTVELHLVAPDPALFRTLSQPSGMIASPDKVGTGSLATTPDGTGPYELDKKRTVSGSEYVYTKRDDYWDKDLALPYSTIIFKPMTDITARVNALASGQIDGAPIDTKSVKQVKGSGDKVVQSPSAGVVGLYLLDRAGALQPALADIRVRQAINLALDRSSILAKMQDGLGTATDQVFNPASGAFDSSLDDSYAFDVDKAKSLMADAGYADGFTLEMPDVTAAFAASVVAAQSLEDIGITVKWDKVAQTEMIPAMLSGKYPAILMQLQSTEPWQTVQFFVAPNAPWNALHSEDPKLDSLISAAQNATGDDQDTAFQDINSWLVDNAWFAPLYFPDILYATNTKIKVTPQYMQGPPSIYNYAPAS